MMLKNTLEGPLDCKEIKPVNPDAKAEAPILWPPVAKNQLIRKEPDTEKD